MGMRRDQADLFDLSTISTYLCSTYRGTTVYKREVTKVTTERFLNSTNTNVKIRISSVLMFTRTVLQMISMMMSLKSFP